MLSDTKLHRTWTNMKQRCHNPKNDDYSYYGARGIKVCDEWVNDFKAFYDWSMSHGYEEHLTIVTHNGEKISLKEFARISGIKYTTLYMRYKKGVVEYVL